MTGQRTNDQRDVTQLHHGGLSRYLPGLAVAVSVAIVARVAALTFLPSWLSEVLVAVALGVAVSSFIGQPEELRPGYRFATTTLLRTGIVLLGAQLSIDTVARIGGLAVGLIASLMLVAFVVAIWGGRYLGIPPRLALLIAVGTAICGNTAIVSMASIIKAEDREVSYAVGVITLFGMLAVFIYPLFGLWLALSEPTFGVWAGSAINDTSQVVAAGTAFGTGALAVATVVKLTRNALMLPVLIGVSLVSGQSATRLPTTLLRAIPLFVVGFLLVALARSAGFIGAGTASALYDLARVLILIALGAVGLSTSIRDLAATGTKPLVLGLAVAACIAALSLAILWLTGMAQALA